MMKRGDGSSLNGGNLLIVKNKEPDVFVFIRLITLIAFTAAAMAFITLPLTLKASGPTYYFSTSGADRNDGLSSGTPKMTLGAAASLMRAGVTILFKKGDVWYNPNYQWDLSNKAGTSISPITIDAYGTGNNPIIAGMELMTSPGWSTAGTNKWKHVMSGYTDAVHCYVDGKSKLKVDISALDANTKFAVSAGYVYLYSAEAPTFVEVVSANNMSIFVATNISYTTIRNIDFRGGGRWQAIEMTAPSDHFTLESCTLKEFSSYGIRFVTSTNTAEYHNVPQILNCYMNKVWSPAENKTEKSPGGDIIELNGAVEGAIVKGNTVIDFGHVGIAIYGESSGYHGCKNNIVEQNDVYLIYSNYGHAFTVQGLEGLCTYNIFRRNYFHDYKCTSHVLGDHNKIYSNVFANVDVSPSPTKQGSAMDLDPFKDRGQTYPNVCHDNIVLNNTIYDCEENPIYVNQYSPGVAGTGNVIKNNLIVKWNTTDHSGNPNYGINISSAVTNIPTIDSNGFWESSSTGKVLIQGTNTYTAVEASTLSYAKNNLQQDPMFIDEANRNFRLASTSPYRSGGQVHTEIGSDFVDFDGKEWDSMSPSIGAFQYTDSSTSIKKIN